MSIRAKNAVQTRQKHFPSEVAKGSLAEGRDKMARTSNVASSYSKIALSTLIIKVNRSLSNDLNLAGSDCQ